MSQRNALKFPVQLVNCYDIKNEMSELTYTIDDLPSIIANEDNMSDQQSNVSVEKSLVRRLPRHVCPSVCAVCGETASGYHYEVPSCNGCKTFFRRSILNEKAYKCKNSKDCLAHEKVGKTLCRACRFAKCLQLGMNSTAIKRTMKMKEDEIQNEAIRKRISSSEDEPVEEKGAKLVPQVVVTLQQNVGRLIDELSYLEVKSEMFRSCKYNPRPDSFDSGIEKLVGEGCLFNLADKLGPMPNWPIPEPKYTLKDDKYEEIIISTKFGENRKNWLLFDLLVAVEYAKAFPFFHKLSIRDRKLLVRNTSLSTMNITQAFHSYCKKSADILHPDGTRPMFYQQPQKFNGFLQFHRKVLNSVIRNKITHKEYVFLKAITLCNTGTADLSDSAIKTIEDEKKKLNEAFCAYCLQEYGNDGPSRYAANLAIIDVLEHMARNQRDHHLLMNIKTPSKKAPLVMEVFEPN